MLLSIINFLFANSAGNCTWIKIMHQTKRSFTIFDKEMIKMMTKMESNIITNFSSIILTGGVCVCVASALSCVNANFVEWQQNDNDSSLNVRVNTNYYFDRKKNYNELWSNFDFFLLYSFSHLQFSISFPLRVLSFLSFFFICANKVIELFVDALIHTVSPWRYETQWIT